jgi:hypothetical protein
MVRFHSGSNCRPRLAVILVGLTVAVAARPAHARQVLFVSNRGSNTVGEYNAVTGAAINTAFINGQGLNQPEYMASDGNNHLFVISTSIGARTPNDTVGQYNATSGATINATFALTGYSFGLAADGNNRLFVPSFFYGVSAYDATTGASINPQLIASPGGIDGVAVDNNNHVFVGNFNGGSVGKYDATSGTALNTLLVSGLGFADVEGLDVSRNHLFVAHSPTGQANSYTVGEYDATTGATLNATFFSSAGVMAFDGNNHVFMANSGNTVGEYDATTGGLIDPAFISGLNGPAGLVFMAPVPVLRP